MCAAVVAPKFAPLERDHDQKVLSLRLSNENKTLLTDAVKAAEALRRRSKKKESLLRRKQTLSTTDPQHAVLHCYKLTLMSCILQVTEVHNRLQSIFFIVHLYGKEQLATFYIPS